MTLVTTSFRLAAAFARCDTYCEIAESHRLPGGETGTCAVVLAGLGLPVHLDGNFLGRNTCPELVSYFASSRISLDLITYGPDFEGLENMVFIGERTRTALGRFGDVFADKSLRRWNSANEKPKQRAAVVGLDPFSFKESAEVARLCSKHAVKYATIDCRLDFEVRCLSEVDVRSEEFLRGNYADQDFESLWLATLNEPRRQRYDRGIRFIFRDII